MTYQELNLQITNLENLPGIEFFILGYSTLGQPIYCVHLGDYTGKQILIEGGIHAREYPATLTVVGIIEYLSTVTLSGGVYAIPLANPDGARLVLDGPDFLPCQNLKDYILQINNGSLDFSQWKANAMAVDLNVNFDALWGEGAQNVTCPAPGNFIGYYPDSEREVRELIDFTFRKSPALTLSFHTKGEVIYYGFETLTPEEIARDLEIAEFISSINGYTPIKTENSVGGYSDFVSEYLRVPAFTIDFGSISAPTPIPLDLVPDAIERNKTIPAELLTLISTNQQNNI